MVLNRVTYFSRRSTAESVQRLDEAQVQAEEFDSRIPDVTSVNPSLRFAVKESTRNFVRLKGDSGQGDL
jgi:hypothetical protein